MQTTEVKGFRVLRDTGPRSQTKRPLKKVTLLTQVRPPDRRALAEAELGCFQAGMWLSGQNPVSTSWEAAA